MRLPNADRAEIDPEKLRGYLLALDHSVGRFKARFFLALGYSADHWQKLEFDLRRQHLTKEAEPGEDTAHGRAFTIRAILTGPNGQAAVVQSVWFIPRSAEVPHFVTAYPGGDR